MRPRFLILFLIIGLLIAALLFWRRPVHQPANTEQPQATAQAANAPMMQPNPVGKNPPAAAPTPSVNLPRIVTGKLETPEQAKQEIESANLPVDFFGLVVDQNSNPIPGVKIKSGVRHWEMPDISHLPPGSKILGASGGISLEATTGPDGRFELTGATGDGFGVLLFKDGYEAESEKNSFGTGGSYSYANPVIFKMWSTNIHEKLITGSDGFKIVPDGRSYFINLTDNTISESGTGDLRVWIQYTNHVVPGQVSDWSSGIEAINGGLLEESLGSPMFEAPPDGYVPTFETHSKIRGGQRGNTGERQFYLRLQNGQEYGQMSIGLYAPFNDQTPGLIRLSYAINPSGSRILR